MLKAVLGHLPGVGGNENEVSLMRPVAVMRSASSSGREGGGGTTYLELGVNDLDDDVLVGEPDDQSVLGGVVLVLGLRHETLPGVV